MASASSGPMASAADKDKHHHSSSSSSSYGSHATHRANTHQSMGTSITSTTSVLLAGVMMVPAVYFGL